MLGSGLSLGRPPCGTTDPARTEAVLISGDDGRALGTNSWECHNCPWPTDSDLVANTWPVISPALYETQWTAASLGRRLPVRFLWNDIAPHTSDPSVRSEPVGTLESHDDDTSDGTWTRHFRRHFQIQYRCSSIVAETCLTFRRAVIKSVR